MLKVNIEEFLAILLLFFYLLQSSQQNDIHKFDKYLELIYSDNGTGIKKEQINEIFKEYYTTKRGTGGTGLGLGIVNNLITNKLKGSIKVESGDEEGLKYIIIIPLDN